MEFLDKNVVLAVHDAQLARHGGAAGLRGEALLDSALALPQNAYAYGIDDVFALAASLAAGMLRNAAFVDANKRTAWVCARVFLRLNGVALAPEPGAAVEAVAGLAEGRLDEARFADWLALSEAEVVPGAGPEPKAGKGRGRP